MDDNLRLDTPLKMDSIRGLAPELLVTAKTQRWKPEEFLHTLIALGIAAVEHGHRVRYYTAADLVETLYRGLADISVASSRPCCATTSCSSDELGFSPLDDTDAQLLSRFVAAAYERRSVGIASHWSFES